MAIDTHRSEPSSTVTTPTKSRRSGAAGFWARMRRGGRDEKRDQTPSTSPDGSPDRVSADEEYKWPSKAGYHYNNQKSRFPTRTRVTIEPTPPAARDSAFHGPPRYDWIDIETAAAVKVQAAFRRNRVMNEMEKKGITTAAIRNRARKREAEQHEAEEQGLSDVVSCCGMGLAFGMDESDPRVLHKESWFMKKRAKAEREAEARNNYRLKHSLRNRQGDTREAIEVVE